MAAKGDSKPTAPDLRALLGRYRVSGPDDFNLDSYATDDRPGGLDKQTGRKLLTQTVAKIAELQQLLYANAGWSLLLIFQAMDAAGKDSTIEHVLTGINPQGVAVTSFKAPGPDALSHDFLWRITKALPARGMIGVFNRSHYEEVLVARVHPELLVAQGLPDSLRQAEGIWDARICDIAAFEAYLGRQGTRILKFFLNVSRDEQKERLLARLDDPQKTWKFDPADLKERDLWPKYRKAYAAAIAGTATPTAPWFVVPADRKWFTRLVVATAVLDTLQGLELVAPPVKKEVRAALEAARRTLEAS